MGLGNGRGHLRARLLQLGAQDGREGQAGGEGGTAGHAWPELSEGSLAYIMWLDLASAPFAA